MLQKYKKDSKLMLLRFLLKLEVSTGITILNYILSTNPILLLFNIFYTNLQLTIAN